MLRLPLNLPEAMSSVPLTAPESALQPSSRRLGDLLVERQLATRADIGKALAFQQQFGPVARQERGSGQRHRSDAGADAAAAAGAAAAPGSVSGPFWPQPASSAPQAHANRVVTQPAATLDFDTFRMRGF